MKTAALRATPAQLALEVTEVVECKRCRKAVVLGVRCRCGAKAVPPVHWHLLENAPTFEGRP